MNVPSGVNVFTNPGTSIASATAAALPNDLLVLRIAHAVSPYRSRWTLKLLMPSGAQTWAMPPSTNSSAPFTKLESGEDARKRTALATSSGSANAAQRDHLRHLHGELFRSPRVNPPLS